MEDNYSDLHKVEDLIASMGASFVNLPAEQVDENIEWALERLAKFINFDRGTLLNLPDTDGRFRGTHCWARDGSKFHTDYCVSDFPWVYGTIHKTQKPLFIENIDEMADEAEEDKKFFKRINIKKIIFIPIVVGGNIIGSLSFGAFDIKQSIPKNMLNQLSVMSIILANALQRRNNEAQLKQAIKEIQELQDKLAVENISLQEEIRAIGGCRQIIGQSDAMRKVIEQVNKVAQTDSTVLILGETGTGKELIARAIHEGSSRKNKLLVRIDCGGLPPSIIENELFGHEKGAFTGAVAKQLGRLEIADGSTLFLDEIGELPLNVQTKLLRMLEEGQFERLGSYKTINVNVRVIAATNRTLAEDVRNGSFREDLYYRLNVFPISIPPLRMRKVDIPILIEYYAKFFAKRLNKNITGISSSDIAHLVNYNWPGNIRELRNIIERSVILAQGPVLRIKISEYSEDSCCKSEIPLTLQEMERRHILEVLQHTRWRVSGKKGAASILDVNPKTLESRMKKLGIQRGDVPPPPQGGHRENGTPGMGGAGMTRGGGAPAPVRQS